MSFGVRVHAGDKRFDVALEGFLLRLGPTLSVRGQVEGPNAAIRRKMIRPPVFGRSPAGLSVETQNAVAVGFHLCPPERVHE
jgi:hypothetical protein